MGSHTTKRRSRGKTNLPFGRVTRFLIALAVCNIICLTSFMLYVWSSSEDTSIVESLKKRVRDLERDAAYAVASVGTSKGAGELVDGIPCDGCDLAVSAELNRRFNFFVLNLDRRQDKMSCVRKQFARFGIHARRMPGIDSLQMDIQSLKLLPKSVKAFLKNNPQQSGHVGCLYGHIRFFMGAASGNDGCGSVDKELVSDESGNHDDNEIALTFHNRWSKPVELLWIRADGTEQRTGGWLAPGDKRVISTVLLHAWRVREKDSRTLMSQFKLDHRQSPSSAYIMNNQQTAAFVYIFGCPPSSRSDGSQAPEASGNKVSIIFEDDVVLRDDFAEKLLWSFEQMREKREPWDIFLLNWYCNSAHWKECDMNKGTSAVASKPFDSRDRRLYSYTSHLGEYSIPRVKYFMSGGGYAVSTSGARKLLDTFPCDSMAVDWHMSTLIRSGVIKAVGASPPFVLMPDMGSVQSLKINTPPNSLLQVCGTYKSDTHYDRRNRAPILGNFGSASAVSEVVLEIEAEKTNIDRKMHAKFSETGVSHPGSRFTAFDKPLSWTSASAFCKSKGKRLATILSGRDNEEATSLAREACGHTRSQFGGWDLCAWIGLNDFKEEGKLVWESSSSTEYTNFLEGEPNNMGDEDGMAVCWTFNGQWIDYSNSQSLPCLLCEKYDNPRQQIVLTQAQKERTNKIQQTKSDRARRQFQRSNIFFGKHKS